MKEISLAPYPGKVWFTTDYKEFLRAYKRMDGRDFEKDLGKSYDQILGTSQTLYHKYGGQTLVFARKGLHSTYAHEFTHVLLELFHHIGLEPHTGNGEAFAYMLAHMLREAGVK